MSHRYVRSGRGLQRREDVVSLPVEMVHYVERSTAILASTAPEMPCRQPRRA
jgi:hypothetical protein